MYLVYSAAAYPFGVLADHFEQEYAARNWRWNSILANLVLAGADSFWMTMLGGGLWGLQMGVTQGLLSAAVADAAPEHLRGTAFGVFELITGVATFMASACAGLLWMVEGPAWRVALEPCSVLPHSQCCCFVSADRPADDALKMGPDVTLESPRVLLDETDLRRRGCDHGEGTRL